MKNTSLNQRDPVSLWPRRLGVILLFILFLNLFFFHSFGTLGFALVMLGGFFSLFGIIGTIRERARIHLVFAAAMTVFALLLVSRTSMPAVGVLGVSLFGMLVVYLYLASRGVFYLSGLLEVVMIPLLLIRDYFLSLGSLWKIASSGTFSFPEYHRTHLKSSWPWVRTIVLGLMIGIPIVLILTSMLSGADPIFATYVKKSTDWLNGFWPNLKWPEHLTDRFVISGVLLGIFAPLAFLTVKRFSSPLGILSRLSFAREWSIAMSLVGVVLGAFLVIQWPYIFVSVAQETQLSVYGVATYSEYVQKGFGELLQVVMFVYGLVWAGLLLIRHAPAGTAKGLLIIQGVILAEFSIFILSIFRRIALYQEYHGWSLVRIYGGILLIWLSGITLTLIARHIQSRRWIVWESVFTGVILLTVGLFNAEDFVSRHHPPTVNHRVDYVYLSRLSADGYEGWKRSFDYAKEVLETRTVNEGILDADDRRDIAYAGMVVHKLTENYLSLLAYGSDAEQREVYRQFLASRIDLLGRLEEVPLQKDSYAPSKESMLNAIRTRAAVQLNRVEQDENAWKTVPVYLFSWPYEFTFRMQRGILLEAFGTIADTSNGIFWGPNARIDDTLGRIYTWNYREAQTYSKMKQNIRMEEILSLQDQFLMLTQRISQQPDNEQDFEHDISIESPFVSSL